jgi:hypothetical protein
MRSTLQITGATTTEDGALAIEFNNGQVITLTDQQWNDEIYQCQTNYPIALMRSLLVQKYLVTSTVGGEAVFNTDAPNGAWIEKIG